MFVHFCFALLTLSSLTLAAGTDCDEVIKPMKDLSRVPGKWILSVGTTDSEELLQGLKALNSSWVDFSAVSDSDEMNFRYGTKMSEYCMTGSGNTSVTTENITRVTFYINFAPHEYVGEYLVTCPDCLAWLLTENHNRETKKTRIFYLFTKTGTLDAAHLEAAKAQTGCLGFPEVMQFTDAPDLCPDDKDAKEKEQ